MGMGTRMLRQRRGVVSYRERRGAHRHLGETRRRRSEVIVRSENGKHVYEAAVRRFLPAGFPQSVSRDYTEWLRLHLASIFVRDVLDVVSTQSLLVALGIDVKMAGEAGGDTATTALALGAAAKWVLKDGLGSFAVLVAGGALGSRVDEEPRKYWAGAALGEDFAKLLELVTPVMPSLFLPLAATASVVGGLAVVTRTALLATFVNHVATKSNSGDVRARLEVQGRVLKLIALPAGIALFRVVGETIEGARLAAEVGGSGGGSDAANGALFVVASLYLSLIAAHNVLCRRAVSVLAFDTLTRGRLLRLADDFLAKNGSNVMSPEEMAREGGGGEGKWLREDEREPPLLGVPCGDDTSRIFDNEVLDMAAEVHASDPFLVATERDGTVRVLVDESACDADLVRSALNAVMLQRALLHTSAVTRDVLLETREGALTSANDFTSACLACGWRVDVVLGGSLSSVRLRTLVKSKSAR